MRWMGHVAHKGVERTAYIVFVGKPEEKRTHERPRNRWKIILNQH
jgi:hypothetical protein